MLRLWFIVQILDATDCSYCNIFLKIIFPLKAVENVTVATLSVTLLKVKSVKTVPSLFKQNIVGV